MSSRVLVAYASKCGSTGEVAEAIGQVLCDAGMAVDVRRVQDVQDLHPYRAVVIGSAARMGRLLPDAVRFAKKHAQALSGMTTAYFTTGTTMKEDTPENRKMAASFLDPLRQIKEPVGLGLFAGKVDPATLEPLWRLLMSQVKSGAMAAGEIAPALSKTA